MSDVQIAFEKEWDKQHYVCPQCGPDPRGAEAHAEAAHTFDGLLGDGERAARGKVAGLSEVVMRTVVNLEMLEERMTGEENDSHRWTLQDECKRLRRAVLAAT